MMTDIIALKVQQKTLQDRIKLTLSQDTLVHNLKATKARSRFIQNANLNIAIYKYEPSDHLEIVGEDVPQKYPVMFKQYQDFKDREMQRFEYERWLA